MSKKKVGKQKKSKYMLFRPHPNNNVLSRHIYDMPGKYPVGLDYKSLNDQNVHVPIECML